MAALLVSLAVMAVLMSVALPVWRHQSQREREAELIFRGEQYARAIGLYQRRTGGFPASIDVLVQQRFLRKKFKDPMTPDGEFQTLTASGIQQGQNQPGGRGAQPGGRGVPPGGLGGAPTPQQGTGGLMGVVSKSKEASIRIYRGGTHYNEWQFIFAGATGRPGGPGPGRGAPGMGPGAVMPPGGMGPGGGRGRGQGPGGGRGMGPGGQGPGRGFGPGGLGPGGRRGGGGVQ